MPAERTGRTTPPPSQVSALVREFRDEILAGWRDAARELPSAKDMSAANLLDHVPDLLDEIADIAEEIAATAQVAPVLEAARRHALDRLGDGFDIATIVRELSLLRDAALSVWQLHAESRPIAMADVRALNLAIDRAIAVSAGRYTEIHARTLAGIDRISTASFESSDVDELMRRLLAVFIETTPAADTAVILLAEGDRLRVRAAAGLEAERDQRDSVEFGEGFAGTIAAQRAPLQLRTAYQDPIVTSDVIRHKKVLAMYGVPLVHNGELIGVAHMGSVTAHEFTLEDRQFFRSMAARATLGIVHHLLREDLARSEQGYRQTAAERERALAKLESLLAAAPIGIGFIDRELRYLRINEALASLNQLPAAAHIGRTVGEMLPAFASALEPLLRDVIDTGRPVLNLELTRPPRADPGDARSLLASYFPVRAGSGEITGVGGIVIDVTEGKRAEEELRIAVRTRDDLLAVVSHDLRSPLGAVQLSAAALLGKLAADHPARRQLDVINRSCIRMESLINDLLDTVSIRTGRLQLNLQPEPASAVVAEAIELHQPLADERAIRLVRDADVEGIRITCDRHRVLQVFSNLIGNAVKFCRPGDTITVAARRDGPRVEFAVRDTGPGIQPGIASSLFDPYRSGAGHGAQGAGLGLYIARGIVEQHKGDIWFEPDRPSGAAFLFTLPIS